MSAATVPPAALAEAATAVRGFLRVDQTTEADTLDRLTASAIEVAEAFVRCSLIRRAHEDVVPASTAWMRLAGAPVAAITTVAALDADGTESALPIGGHAVDIDAGGHGWVRATLPLPSPRLVVRYEAGLATGWAALPRPLAQGVVALAAHLFDDRAGTAQPPAAVTALLRPWRQLSLDTRRSA